MDASLFSVKLLWMQEVKGYLKTGQMPKTLNLTQKQKLARKAKKLTLKEKEGKMYKMGQDNRMWNCFDHLKSIDCS